MVRPTSLQLRAAASWLGTAAVALVATAMLVRLLGVPRHVGGVFALEVFAPLLLVPAIAGAVLAAVARRRLLGGAAAFVLLAQLVATAPELRWWPVDQPEAVGPPIRVVAANLLRANPTPEAAIDRVLAEAADVLVVTELSTPVDRALAARFTHAAALPDDLTNFGVGVYAEHPIRSWDEIDLGGVPALRVELAVHGHPLDLVAVHTRQPLNDLDALHRQLGQLRDLADRERGPLVVAGDFNSTTQHRPFRALLATRLRDAHLETGRGLARTWPADRRVPPFALIDHVLVSDELAVEATAEVTIPGSDHRAVTATLRRAAR